MPYVTVQTANRIWLTKAEAILLIDALNVLRNTTKPHTADGLAEVEELLQRLKSFVSKSDWSSMKPDWSPMEK